MYSTNAPEIVNGIVVPTTNVATTTMAAMVISGVSRTRNALLNGNYVDYDWDFGYTCHQLGSGEIVIGLGSLTNLQIFIFYIYIFDYYVFFSISSLSIIRTTLSSWFNAFTIVGLR